MLSQSLCGYNAVTSAYNHVIPSYGQDTFSAAVKTGVQQETAKTRYKIVVGAERHEDTSDLADILHTYKAFIVELSVPFDRFIDLCYQHKFNKYIELCNKCNELGYHTRIIVLIIGSLGLVHNKFVNGLKVIGLTTSKAKAIAKYVSVSAQIGSYLCWSSKMRK